MLTENSNQKTNSDTSGVHYYNKEQQRIKKEDILVEETSTSIEENRFLSSSSGLAPASLSHQAKPSAEVSPGSQEESGGVGLAALEEETEPFYLDGDQIERAPIQLWDNGENSSQRYKLKVRLNLVNETESPEFIASLTKDFRNFKKYIPAECREHIITQASHIRSAIKNKFGSYPYIGKFHLANPYVKGCRQSNQIEPWTIAAVWWDTVERGWSGLLCIHDWALEFDLFEQNITSKQRDAGCKATMLYINPLHDKRVRPKTWLQKRSRK